MKRIVVLGAGRVGKEIARDLSRAFDVTAVDRDAESMARAFGDAKVRTRVVDLSDPAVVASTVAPFDLVVGALPGSLGYAALEAVIRAGKDVVDISFLPEDPFRLHDLAREKGVTALVDMGVAPGMSNLFLGRAVEEMMGVERFECVVGGLPAVRTRPFEYKAPFSPADVIEEYVRPARFVEGGRVVVRPALSEVEEVEIPGLGTLEAFLTDGLRSLLTLPVRSMKEKTLRYPGHARLMATLRETGFFSEEPVDAGGVEVVPRDVAAALLFPRWAYAEGEEDLTIMRVVIEGRTRVGGGEVVTWELLDRARDGVSSMARTTGYPCAAAVHLVASGRFRRPGVSAPEHVGTFEECFRFVLDYLAAREVRWERRA